MSRGKGGSFAGVQLSAWCDDIDCGAPFKVSDAQSDRARDTRGAWPSENAPTFAQRGLVSAMCGADHRRRDCRCKTSRRHAYRRTASPSRNRGKTPGEVQRKRLNRMVFAPPFFPSHVTTAASPSLTILAAAASSAKRTGVSAARWSISAPLASHRTRGVLPA